jgi:uncharacterized membrane protein YfcA
MISVPFAAALTASVLCTAFISGVFGMAGGMILMGLLLALMPLASATQIAANAARAWLWRQQVCWPIVACYAAGALIAVAIIAFGPVTPTKPMALIFIGLMSLVGLSVPARWTPDIMDRRQAVGCGTLCTIMHLTCGVSGPTLDLFFVRADLGTRQIVATKAAINTCGHFVKLAYFGHALLAGGGALSPVAIALALAAALLGTQLSRILLEAIDDASFRRWSRRLIAAIAAISLVQGVTLQLQS